MRERARWRLSAPTILAVAVALGAADPAWAKDPLFQAMGVLHGGRETPAPEFSLATPDGTSIALAQLEGKVVFLNFWATWCPPCREKMPSMERLHKEFKDQGLAILAVDIGESPKQVTRFMKEFRLSFPALLDTDYAVSARYGIQGLPSTFLIDRGGRVVGKATGARDWASPKGKALIRSLLDQQR
jgi:peroxiredoxin